MAISKSAKMEGQEAFQDSSQRNIPRILIQIIMEKMLILIMIIIKLRFHVLAGLNIIQERNSFLMIGLLNISQYQNPLQTNIIVQYVLNIQSILKIFKRIIVL
jgi:hypothetical protein